MNLHFPARDEVRTAPKELPEGGAQRKGGSPEGGRQRTTPRILHAVGQEREPRETEGGAEQMDRDPKQSTEHTAREKLDRDPEKSA